MRERVPTPPEVDMKTMRAIWLTALLSIGSIACDAQISDGKDGASGPSLNEDQQADLVALQQQAGGPVHLELGDGGGVRVLDMTEGHHLVGLVGAPEDVAQSFLSQHRAPFQLSTTEATDFEATRVDVDPGSNVKHVTLQRTVQGIPVYQGAVTVHIDSNGGIFRVMGDDNYHVGDAAVGVDVDGDGAL